MDKSILEGKSCFCPCLHQAPQQGDLGSVGRTWDGSRSGKVSLRKGGYNSSQGHVHIGQRIFLFHGLCFPLFCFACCSVFSLPVGGARKETTRLEKEEGTYWLLPLPAAPCLLLAPACTLGTRFHTFSSTSFPEQQLRPICSFFDFCSKPLQLSHTPSRISSISGPEHFPQGTGCQPQRVPALSWDRTTSRAAPPPQMPKLQLFSAPPPSFSVLRIPIFSLPFL